MGAVASQAQEGDEAIGGRSIPVGGTLIPPGGRPRDIASTTVTSHPDHVQVNSRDWDML